MFTMEPQTGGLVENIRFDTVDTVGVIAVAEVKFNGNCTIAARLLNGGNFDAAVTAALCEARNRALGSFAEPAKVETKAADTQPEARKVEKPKRKRKTVETQQEPETDPTEFAAFEDPVDALIQNLQDDEPDETGESSGADDEPVLTQNADSETPVSESEVTPCQTEAAPEDMTLEEALKVVFPSGAHRGKTVAQVAEEDPHGLRYYAEKCSAATYKEVSKAARVFLANQ